MPLLLPSLPFLQRKYFSSIAAFGTFFRGWHGLFLSEYRLRRTNCVTLKQLLNWRCSFPQTVSVDLHVVAFILSVHTDRFWTREPGALDQTGGSANHNVMLYVQSKAD